MVTAFDLHVWGRRVGPILLLCAQMVSTVAWAQTSAPKAFNPQTDALVILHQDGTEAFRINGDVCAEKVAPCSTFKIWNSAIGLELGEVTDPDAPFWKWDGILREIADWNRDQTLRSAIAVSCVPAYQDLARKIGAGRMQDWLGRIGYADSDISAGIDVFWLPDPPHRKTILISPDEQAQLLLRLADGKLPFSAKTLMTLRSIMNLRTTDRGTLYGKTGTGSDPQGVRMGWFVGYVEASGKTHAFACLVKGEGLMGKDARMVAEKILAERGLL